MSDTTSHPGIPCSSCKTMLPFIEYGTKIGKNDKPAKWPIYEKCTNPECKTGRKNLAIKGTPVPAEPVEFVPLPEPKKGPPSSMHQWNLSRAYPPVYYAFFAAFKLASQNATSTSITRIFMHEVDAQFLAEQFPDDVEWREGVLVLLPPEGVDKPEMLIETKDIRVTKKFRYFVVEIREPVEIQAAEEATSEEPA